MPEIKVKVLSIQSNGIPMLSCFSRVRLQPRGQQPTRLPCPRDSPGKNTGVGCHFPSPLISGI